MIKKIMDRKIYFGVTRKGNSRDTQDSERGTL